MGSAVSAPSSLSSKRVTVREDDALAALRDAGPEKLAAALKSLTLDAEGGVEALSRRLLAARELAPYPVTNDHPALAGTEPGGTGFDAALSNWLLFLPAAATKHLRLEPNFADKCGTTDMWCGRLWHLQRILWLQFCSERTYSLDLDDDFRAELDARYAPGTIGETKLLWLQTRVRLWFVQMRNRPSFLVKLWGVNIRSVVIFMHGSGGMTWGNPRLCRLAAHQGCVVFAPDHMSSAEWRSRTLMPLHKHGDDTSYWNNSLFYASKEHKNVGESLEFDTSVEGVLGDVPHYKQLYERVFQVRRNELHFLLKRLPKQVHSWGVILMGTSEGAMSVYRFDDQRYGDLIQGRVINAFAGEY